jgi:hypothetical protein
MVKKKNTQIPINVGKVKIIPNKIYPNVLPSNNINKENTKKTNQVNIVILDAYLNAVKNLRSISITQY